MKKIIAITLCMILFISVTGCGAVDVNGTDCLNISMNSSPATMDGQLATDVGSARAISLYTSTLLAYNKNNELLPALAESYDVSDDGLTYTFHLKNRLKWSDGRDLTAKDFVFALRRLADPDTGSGAIFMIADACTIKNVNRVNSGECSPEELGVSAPDDTTFVVDLENPCPYFPSLITAAAFVPCNEDFFKECNGEYATASDKILSCGAYSVDRYEPLAVQINYVKNPYYYAPADKLPEEITLQVIKNTQQAVMCYQTGMLDAALISGDLISWLEGDNDLIAIDYANSQFITFGNIEKTPANNKHIRRAMTMAVDREGIVKNVVRAGAYTLNRINPQNSYLETDGTDFSADDHRYDDVCSYDPEAAKKEWEQGLKELGIDSVEMEFAFPQRAQSKCEAIKQEWEKTLPGLKINLNMLQSKDWVLATTKAVHDILYQGWAADYIDPTAFFNLFKTGSHGEGAYSNPAVDELLEKSNTSEIVGNPDERNKILHKTEDLLMEDSACIPLYSDQVCYLVNSEYPYFDLTPTSCGFTIDSLERRD